MTRTTRTRRGLTLTETLLSVALALIIMSLTLWACVAVKRWALRTFTAPGMKVPAKPINLPARSPGQ